jgi:phosphoserine phosphatase
VITEPALCIDLDGTLIFEDTVRLAAMQLIKKNPFYLVLIGFWLLRGIAHMKRQLAQRTTIDPRALTYNTALLEWIKSEKASGRKIVLASATDKIYADAVANYVGIFYDVVASEGHLNLRRKNKALALDQRYGIKNYDYAGNSRDDLIVWQHSRQAIVVNAPASVIKQAKLFGNVLKVF